MRRRRPEGHTAGATVPGQASRLGHRLPQAARYRHERMGGLPRGAPREPDSAGAGAGP